jgi:hypothetical protein
MNAFAFDPWAALKSRREGQPPPNPPNLANPPLPYPPDPAGLGALAGLGTEYPAPAHLQEGNPPPPSPRAGGFVPALGAPPDAPTLPGVPFDWCEGVALLATMPAPPTIPPPRWAVLATTATRLLRDHGAELHVAGWTDVDLLGLDAAAPAANPAGWGLAWLLGEAGDVLDVAFDAVVMRRDPDGALLTYRRHTAMARAGVVLAWRLNEVPA